MRDCPAAWVTGDEVYGADPGLRADLERRQIGYVLAVAASHQVTTAAGTCQARKIAARLPRRAWQRYSAGEGAKGHRYYDWAWLAIDPGRPGHRWLLIRRNRHTRRAGVLPLLQPPPRPAAPPGQDRRDPLDHGGEFPGRQGTDRAGRAPGPPLGLLVPVDHPGHARPGLPHHRRRHRARRSSRRQLIRSRSPATRSPRCSAR